MIPRPWTPFRRSDPGAAALCAVPLTAALLLVPLPVHAQEPDGGSPPGVTVPRVVVGADTGQAYALRLPPGHGPHRRWPVLVLMDPRGRARVPLALFQDAADRLGYVVLSSYNTSSDQPTSQRDTEHAVEFLLNDALDRLSLDPTRIYLAGFSGTARVAWAMAVRIPDNVRGIAGFGGGIPPLAMAASDSAGFPFDGAFYGGAGLVDFNYQDLRATDRTLDRLGVFHTVRYFPGPHAWPPAEVAAEAVDWFELHAMRTGLAPVDSSWARARLAVMVSEARSLEAADRYWDAWRVYDRVVTGFQGLIPVDDARRDRDRLADHPAVRRARTARVRWGEWELASMRQATAVLDGLDDGPLPTLDALAGALDVESAARQAGAPDGDTLAAQAADRYLALLTTLTAFYYPRTATQQGRHDRVVRLLELAHRVRPDHPGVCFRFLQVPDADRPAGSPLHEACGQGAG